jgi:hypothetical protein
MPRLIALYLPQFHPIPENDEWYGKGFTEWTNVASAKPLFPGHKQPRIPADLGFYDLRTPGVMREQAEMARTCGIEGFSFYHYWFGDGRQLLEKPFQAILADREYNFPFMLHWANGSWSKKLWNAGGKGDKLLMEQTYPGREDAERHFYTLLPAFRDERYIRVDGKLVFAVDLPLNSGEIPGILRLWRELGEREGLDGFFFVAHAAHFKESEALIEGGADALLSEGGMYDGAYDALIDSQYRRIMYTSLLNKGKYVLRKKLGLPNVYDYGRVIGRFPETYDSDPRVFPEVFPRFDHSPRSRGKELVYVGDTPDLFESYLTRTFRAIREKPEDRKLVFIRAWNEWGEGNYLEPDLDSGHGYLEAIDRALQTAKREGL